MKIFIAQSTASAVAGHETYRQVLCNLLERKGHKTQCLDLPSIAEPNRALTNIASLRLLGTAASADVLICLDPVAAVLDHPRKIVFLLDDSYLVAESAQLPGERTFGRDYVAHVLRSSLQEAEHIFAPSRFALERLRTMAIGPAQMLQPSLPPAQFHYQRNPGPELLLLTAINDRQRPELLIACLAALPEPFRARWTAPSAQPAIIAQMRQQAEAAGVEHRLVVDVRQIDPGETGYLLSQAAACLDFGHASVAVSGTVFQALQNGTPTITCSDGGALTELSGPTAAPPAKPDGPVLAEAVRAATAAPAIEPARAAPFAESVARNWAPLLKAITR